MTLLAITNLSARIGGKPVLRDISLTLQAGRIAAITGASGSGKSITALSIMGLPPQGTTLTGQILLDGRDMIGLPEPQLCALRGSQMAMVFQEPMTALNPLQTIGAQISETLRLHDGMNRAQAGRAAAEMLQKVGLDLPASRYPHELSGGQRQRVVIAMAIARRPRLLIADEPTTALDVSTQARILQLLRDLVAASDMGLLLITHDLAIVAQMADDLHIMQGGQIVESGPTGDVLRNRAHPYTRALFAAATHMAQLPPPPVMAVPLLQLRGVQRDYLLPRQSLLGKRRRARVLDDISFDIGRGERVGLVGESGSGKSTLTRAILGLDPVQGGTITLAGAPVRATAGADRTLRRKMQVVFQDPYSSFNPRQRVDRLITEPFHLLDDPPKGAARDAAIAQALRDVGLSPDDRHKFIHAFSGGQRQRLAIARALIINPELIIFDEAVSALDVQVRGQILDLIAAISRDRALAYLFISHDLSVVRSITDRVLVMQAGQIVEHGPTAQILTAPRHPYTRALLDAAPRLPMQP